MVSDYGQSVQFMMRTGGVLILVVMEYGLRQVYSQEYYESSSVLILVVMEYGLRRFLITAEAGEEHMS